MKTSFRKVLSLATASALALSMAIAGSAAEGDTLTRGEMAKLLVEGAGLSDQVAQYQAQESVFQDVAEDSEYKGYINLAYAQGLVSGTSGDTFSPDAQTTQVEAAAAIMQYAGVPDAMLDSWPAAYNETAQRVGLTDGITYNGSAAVTEGQFQAMLTNGSDLVGKPYIGSRDAYLLYAEVSKRRTSRDVGMIEEALVPDSVLIHQPPKKTSRI